MTDEIHKVVRRKQRQKLEYRINVPDIGWLCVDLMVMEKEARENKGYNYGLIIIDIYSRYGWCIPLKRKTAEATAKAFSEWLEGKYNLPKTCFKGRTPVIQVRHDSGGEWAGAFSEVLAGRGISQLWIPPTDYHHSMGIADRFVRTLRDAILKQWIRQNNFDWITPLESILEWYNTRPGDKCNVCYSGVLTKKTTLFKNKDRKIEKTKKITKTKYRIKIITDGNGKKWYRPERRKYYDIKEWAFGIIANFIFYVINYWEHPVDIEYDNVLGYKTLLDAEAQIEIWKMDDLEKEKEKKSKKIIHQEIVKL